MDDDTKLSNQIEEVKEATKVPSPDVETRQNDPMLETSLSTSHLDTTRPMDAHDISSSADAIATEANQQLQEVNNEVDIGTLKSMSAKLKILQSMVKMNAAGGGRQADDTVAPTSTGATFNQSARDVSKKLKLRKLTSGGKNQSRSIKMLDWDKTMRTTELDHQQPDGLNTMRVIKESNTAKGLKEAQ